MSNAVVDNLI